MKALFKLLCEMTHKSWWYWEMDIYFSNEEDEEGNMNEHHIA